MLMMSVWLDDAAMLGTLPWWAQVAVLALSVSAVAVGLKMRGDWA